MLELLNILAHGYVAVPVILACQKQGMLESMSLHEPEDFESLGRRLGANPGHLKVALVLLESLGWVKSGAAGGWLKTPEAARAARLPADLAESLHFPFGEFIDGHCDGAQVVRWFECSKGGWAVGDETWARLLDGMIAIPLLLGLHERSLLAVDEHGAPGFVTSNLRFEAEIAGFFRDQGWMEGARLTPRGRFVAERIYITATVASYRPMLARISEVIFGDCRTGFGRDEDGFEQHVDRRLNVKGSGFQHEKYFADLEATIVALFDHERFDEQPKYVADMGCGDGTLLKRIDQVVREKTARGRVLDRHPLRLLGVDINDKALQETSLTLQGRDFRVLRGDIGNPERLIADLRERGIADPESTLHVRSFLDHDRPYRPPRDQAAAAARARTAGEAVHVDRDGNLLPACDVMQSLVEHLQRWSSAVAGFGLAVLEVHCLTPETIAVFLDQCESLHFDAYHRFSHQYLVTADQFALAAAEVGLFSSALESRRYPKVFPFTRITLNHFRPRAYRVRHARPEDLPRLLQMEGAATAGELEQRVTEHPCEQLVLVHGGLVSGAAYTRWTERGIELISATVAAGVDEGEANEFVEFVEAWSLLKPGCESFFGRERLLRPTCPEVVASAHRFMRAAHGVRDPQGPESELETFGAERLLATFQTLEISSMIAREPATAGELMARVGILPRYERLFQALLKMLERRGRLSLAGGRIVGVAVPDFQGQTEAEATRAFADAFRLRHPEFQPFLNLMLQCLEHYGEVLTGRREVNDVVFPSGGVDLFAGIFEGNSAADYFNGLVGELVAAAVARRPGERCAILEIGAGTGGTTGAVLPRLGLHGDRITFCYTDISSTFTRRAEHRFGPGRPWMRFERLNIEEDPARQGFPAESFDVVYAANVLHDTKELKKTLATVHALLRPGGLLVLNEYTQMKDLLLLTGGLLHGWWLFEDPECRLEGSCLLSIPLWQSILSASGFRECHAFGRPDEHDLAGARQGVMVAVRTEVAEPATGDLDAVLDGAVREILGERRMAAFTASVPLMEGGLDSLELLELRVLIGRRLGVELPASFFFEYSTLEKIAAYLRQRRPASPAPAPAPAPVTPLPFVPPPEAPQGAVAVIGLALRFPGGITSAEAYWETLCGGKSAIAPAASDRWAWPAETDVAGEKAYLARGGFLPRLDEFDAAFFRVSPREAELMDPQQRLLLELSWAAMEDAGYRPSSLRGSRTGVYAGACHFDYRSLLETPGDPVNALLSTGTAASLLANRLSYLYDFQGPSIVFDTACSSSLVALAEAVQAIRSGRCAHALVAGVNLVCGTTNTLAYDHAHMLSRDGECYPFDARAKGYVRGEGGAVLLLKELQTAIRDGDAIHGVIRGAAVNHGGEASSLTAPNPAAQARVISAALADAGVEPESIGYVEAHGTGTPLGDPIEIEGLNAALSVAAAGERACGLGSVKSTLGHLEGAAGLAGVIKVLLCLRHRAIPPSRNFQSLNPEIRLGRAFFIAERLTEWKARPNLPRRGGVSAFGFGGANAHAVLEEFRAPDAEAGDHRPAIFPLSAKSPEALQAMVENLAAWLRRMEASGEAPALHRIAHTLQAGREVWAYRVAFVAGDLRELARKLDEYRGGMATGERTSWSDLLTGEAGRDFVARLARQGESVKLARLWAGGVEIAWELFYPAGRPRSLHLPTYPFARDRFWVPERTARPAPVRRKLTPPALLQDHDGRFTATFQGDEFFFTDHRVAARRVLPGVVHLEMAVLAARALWGVAPPECGLRVTEVFWARPVTMEQSPLTLSLVLHEQTAAESAYRITGDGGSTLFSQGRIRQVPAGSRHRIDLQTYRSGATTIERDRFYANFESLGIDYGPGHRAVDEFYLTADGGLARLVVPPTQAPGDFMLHPGLMDSALQAGVAVLLQLETAVPGAPLLPFALESLEVIAGCGASMWAAVRVDRSRSIPSLEIDVCDEDGWICVRFRGLQTRRLPAGPEATANALSLFCPLWEPVAVARREAPPATTRIAVAGGDEAAFAALRRRYPEARRLEISASDSIEVLAATLEQLGLIEHLVWNVADAVRPSFVDEAMIAGQASGVLLCFRLVKALQRLAYHERPLAWTLITAQTQGVHPGDAIHPLHAALAGFVGVMAKEYLQWDVCAIDGELAAPIPLDAWLTLHPSGSGETLAWRGDRWYSQELVPVDFATEPAALPYRVGGVYVVIGGAGGIGAAWSEWMVRKWRAQIVWIGRRPLDASIEERIAAAGRCGAPPLYFSADATDRAAMERVYSDIKRRFPAIHGVVHSALVLLDQSLARMDEGSFAAALLAQVNTSVRLAQVFGTEPLDFALFFSSIAAFAKAAGQSNYAAGCAFKDAFASRLAQEWACPVKVMNWGYWGSIGRVATAACRAQMADAGLGSIEPEEGMEALEKLLSNPVGQLAAIRLLDEPEPRESTVPNGANQEIFPA
jgi:acyl transferase domain-containing protein/SAM-dependent methyltransferase